MFLHSFTSIGWIAIIHGETIFFVTVIFSFEAFYFRGQSSLEDRWLIVFAFIFHFQSTPQARRQFI